MLEFFKKELDARGAFHVMSDRKEISLQQPFKDVAVELGMSGAEAARIFHQATHAGLIAADFGSAGPNADTALAYVSHLTPDGERMLGEWEEASPQPLQQFTFHGSAYGVFGSQQHFTFEQVVQDLDRRIEEHGGKDKEELREMIAEIQDTLETQDSISRSKFEKWSTLANKHAPWLLGPLGSLLVNYVFGIPGPN